MVNFSDTKKEYHKKQSSHFTPFQTSVGSIPLPRKFTYPFYYDPHPLCIIAAEELQAHIQNQQDWEHNFGLDPKKKGIVIGKMFGVLVVKNQEEQLGYLAAFSGKLANQNHHSGFVPPIFDMLKKDGFFVNEILVLNQLNKEVETLEDSADYKASQKFLTAEQASADQRIQECKQKIKAEKKARKQQRAIAESTLSSKEYEELKERLRQESIKQQYFLKDLIQYWEQRLLKAEQQLAKYEAQLTKLKEERKQKSAALQAKLFDQYQFLNKLGITKSLQEIFKHTALRRPPAGAGDCAAPKLLQYAFQNELEPIAMAEFWWGQSPKSEVRKHKHFYPACKGKCEPILTHMLEGMQIDPNPMLVNPAFGKKLDILWEDEFLLVLNKPAEFLSVPGKNIQDSVYQRIKKKYPEAIGPLVVHRLDMSTSGLMLIAKEKEIHKQLQRQFIKRIVQKRYVALLDGLLKLNSGTIDLPLRVDLNDRPRQLVCYEYGKSARTHWKVIDRTATHTRVHFFPVTGRTHQLRVHAAHRLGLNVPIVGDDLYGTKSTRLHLHAERLVFTHPVSKQTIEIEQAADF